MEQIFDKSTIKTWTLGRYTLQWSSSGGGYFVIDEETGKPVLHAIYRENMTDKKAIEILTDFEEFLKMLEAGPSERGKDEVN